MAEKIVKTLALIYCVNDFKVVPPSWDIISEIYSVNYSVGEIESAKEVLKNCHLLIELMYRPYVRITAGSGHNVLELIQQEMFRIDNGLAVKTIFNDICTKKYLYPVRYNDENEIIRYFEFRFIEAEDLPYIEKTGMAIDSNADGLMYGVLVWAESDIQLATKIISEIENERVVIVLPNNISDYAGVAKEYRAIQKLIEQYRDKEIELLDELGYILEDRANILNAFIENTFFRFEKKMSSVYYKGEKMGIVRKAQLPQLLSQIIQDIYYRTPKIVNELINRNELSSTIKSARAKLLNALFSNISQKDFGLMGNGPEMNILRSLLVLPGIYVQNGDDYYLEYSCADEKTRAVLQAINDFILSADKGKNFEELYAILTKPEYHFGLKQGVIPVYLAVVFLRYKNHLVLRRKDRELPLSAVVMNDIIAAPEEYKIYLEKWNDEKETYIVNLENIFAQYIHSADKSAGSFAYLVKAMRRWYLQLTKYEVTTKNYCSSDGKIESLDISSIRFRNALSNLDINAYDFLFRQVKSIYNSELYSEVTQALRISYQRISNTYYNIHQKLIKEAKGVFGGSDKESLSSVLENFYDDLKLTTKEHMSLKEVYIEKEYRNLKCDIIHEFYIPILQHAVKYKRAVGFFSSSALYEMAIGLTALVKNGGKIELIASPRLTQEDIDEIRLGYRKREEIIENSLMRDFPRPNTVQEQKKLNLLANLIAEGVLDIKIAFKIDLNSVGIFHEKIGIMEDSEGNKVAFTGSMNETYSGLLQNYESIDVFCSWKEEDSERVEIKESAFDKLWDNLDPAMEVIEFPKVAAEKLQSYSLETTQQIIESESFNEVDEDNNFFQVPKNVKFYDYQQDAINSWMSNSCCGIFDMATGAGKTYTALGSITKLSEKLNENLAVIIVAPYQHLVEQWVDDINQFNVKPIIAYSYPGQKWRKYFADAVNAYNTGAIKHFCVIATNATFALSDFQNILSKFRKNFLFVVDEAHNFGAQKLSTLLPKKARYRLALSATIERHRDESGTAALRKYFGKTCISFTLKEAIQKRFLTSYYYHPIVCYLDAEELERYKEITQTIIRNGGASQENIDKNPYIEMLLIKRARIIAGCKDKVAKLVEAMRPYKDDNYILVYCGATKYDNNSNELNDEEEVRQIEEVNKRLYFDLGMRVHKFTSEEDKDERDEIKRMFASGTELQVITAIKCLDEGVNIPAIKKAFILASSTNPKEYIQRRGRVLRKAKGKEYADIFDFITLPRSLESVAYPRHTFAKRAVGSR